MARASATRGILLAAACAVVFVGELVVGQTPEANVAAPSFTLRAASELNTSRPSISLDGPWDFSYDPKDVGEKEQWFLPTATALQEKTTVPGCAQAADHASAEMSEADYAAFHGKQGEYMMDLRWPTLAAAWHRKTFTVPADWRERDVWLHFGGLNPAADIWFNGTKLGSTTTSRCPVRANVTSLVRFDSENVVVVKVFWTEGPRLDGLFSYMAGFSGLYRGVRVESAPRVCVKDLHVVGRIEPRRASVRFAVAGLGQQPNRFRAICKISGQEGQKEIQAEIPLKASSSEEVEQTFEIDMPEGKLWSVDEPNLYTASVAILDGEKPCDSAKARFGLREIRTEGMQILLNGKPIFLRGASDLQWFPETVSPSVSKEFYANRIRRMKQFGFNYTKSCMEVFTQEYLDAADEVGFLVCQEMPFGLTGKYRTAIRERMPDEYVELYRREFANIVRSDRMHPSVILYSMISEFDVGGMLEKTFKLFCQELPTTAKQLNPQALVIDVTCAVRWKTGTKFGPRVTDLIEETAGAQTVQEPLSHPIEGQYEDLDRPFLLHEYCWWTSLPEIALKDRYANLPYKLNGVPELEQAAAKAGFSELLPTLVDRSRRLKHQLQICGLELARRNPKINGYHFWLTHGLSWCQEGVLNEFYEESGITADEFRMCNGDTAVLLDDGNRRDFERDRAAPLGFEISHFGSRKLDKPSIAWQLMDKEKVVGDGIVPLAPIACGSHTAAKPDVMRMPSGADPALLELRVQLLDDGAEICRNRWKLWAFPPPKTGAWASRIATDVPFMSRAFQVGQIASPLNADSLRLPVVVTSRLNAALVNYVEQGGKVVLFSANALRECRPGMEYRPGERIPTDWTAMCDLYRSAPWNLGAHGNMGTVVADHPALGTLPHEGWCDVNFVHLIHGVFPILLEGLGPSRIDPIIRSIGHKNTMIDRAYLFEMKVGRGAILATSLNVVGTYESHPQTRYMVGCLLDYACGDAFQPKAEVSVEKLRAAMETGGQ